MATTCGKEVEVLRVQFTASRASVREITVDFPTLSALLFRINGRRI
jgi:hypothetical protein